VEREQAIEAFVSQEYWSIQGEFLNADKDAFIARLVGYAGKKVDKFDIANETQAKEWCKLLKSLPYTVSLIEKKLVKRHPAPPFTTSTLQQEASRKLGFGASRTMRVAQKLYEGVRVHGELTGLITYMRTDSIQLSQEALAEIRAFIPDHYGKNYLPESVRVYKTRVKNAQEAHEAIRPTSCLRLPDDVGDFLDEDQKALYELIWKRTVASQMESAIFDHVSAQVDDTSHLYIFRAAGSTQIFDGFLRVYQEGKDEDDEGDDGTLLPPLKEKEPASLRKITPDQHFTQPPPRFTEATLVKNLEELGIGRPSTYAPLMQVLQDREYVTLEKRQFIPSPRGRIVTAFLTTFCKKYLEYDFTAHLEEALDDVAKGRLEWKNVMMQFWDDFSKTIEGMKSIRIQEVITVLEQNLEGCLFKSPEERVCPKCRSGKLGLRLSKFGAFVGCEQYPKCAYCRALFPEDNTVPDFEPVDLGVDPQDSSKISLRRGPYGFYLQIDYPQGALAPSTKQNAPRGKTRKPKTSITCRRITLPASADLSEFDLSTALLYKSLPKTVGEKDGLPVQIGLGRFGPYVKWQSTFASIPKSENFLAISEKEAMDLLEKKLAAPARSRRPSKPRSPARPKGGARR
jgi:DNA topoisomerase-1